MYTKELHPPQDLHHQLAGPHGEEKACPSPAEGVAREEVRVVASLVQTLLQLGCELPVVDVLVGPLGEGWGIWWGAYTLAVRSCRNHSPWWWLHATVLAPRPGHQTLYNAPCH